MEMTLCENFNSIDFSNLEIINGGSKALAQGVLLVGGAVMLGLGAPILCAATAGSMVVFATAYLMGISLMGSSFFI